MVPVSVRPVNARTSAFASVSGVEVTGMIGGYVSTLAQAEQVQMSDVGRRRTRPKQATVMGPDALAD